MSTSEDDAVHLTRRLSLWFALGNAAGLVAAAGKLLDAPGAASAYLLFPSCWGFAIGLVAGAGFNIALMVNIRAEENFAAAKTDTKRIEEHRWASRAELAAGLCLVICTLAFLFALFYPLIVLSLRYLASGSFV